MLLSLSFLLASEKQTRSFSFSWGSSVPPSYWLSPLNTLMLQVPLFWIILYLTLLYLLIITLFLSFPQQVVSFAETSWLSLSTPDSAAVASSQALVISNHQTEGLSLLSFTLTFLQHLVLQIIHCLCTLDTHKFNKWLVKNILKIF